MLVYFRFVANNPTISPASGSVPLVAPASATSNYSALPPTASPGTFSNANLSNLTPTGYEQSPSNLSNGNGTPHSNTLQLSTAPMPSQQHQTPHPDTASVQPFSTGNGNNLFADFPLGDFGSYGANLEYAVLSSMLQSSGFGNGSPMTSVAPSLPVSNAFNGNMGSSLQHNMPNSTQHNSSSGHANYQDLSSQQNYGFPPTAFDGNNLQSGQVDTQAMSRSPFANHNDTSLPFQNTESSQSHGQAAAQSHQQSTCWPNPHGQGQQTAAGQEADASQPKTKKAIVSPTGIMSADDVYKTINKPYVS